MFDESDGQDGRGMLGYGFDKIIIPEFLGFIILSFNGFPSYENEGKGDLKRIDW